MQVRFIAIIAAPSLHFKAFRLDDPGEKHMRLIRALYPIDLT
jgi:hypothetical protein